MATGSGFCIVFCNLFLLLCFYRWIQRLCIFVSFWFLFLGNSLTINWLFLLTFFLFFLHLFYLCRLADHSFIRSTLSSLQLVLVQSWYLYTGWLMRTFMIEYLLIFPFKLKGINLLKESFRLGRGRNIPIRTRRLLTMINEPNYRLQLLMIIS
jgi:hypothetical protein